MISNNLYGDTMVVADEELTGKKKYCLAKLFRKCIFPFISQLFFAGQEIPWLFFRRGGHFLGFFLAGQDSFGAFFRPGEEISKLFFSRAGLAAAAPCGSELSRWVQ